MRKAWGLFSLSDSWYGQAPDMKINSNPTPTGYIQDVYIWQANGAFVPVYPFISEIGRFWIKDKQKTLRQYVLPGTLFYPTLLQRYAIFANSKRPRVAKTKIYFSGLNFQKLTVERFADWKTLWANPRAGKQEHKGLRCVVRELSGGRPGFLPISYLYVAYICPIAG